MPESHAPQGVFITGTDTGVGKTFVSCALLKRLHRSGHSVLGMKPVASGCSRIDGEWRNEDALQLQAAGSQSMPYRLINPFALPAATAPEFAAAECGVQVAAKPILESYDALRGKADWVLVEGVGGWLAPLAPQLMQADLARALRLPVVLVVGLRLGCLNHALLSARVIIDDGLPLLGWIGSAIDPDLDYAEAYRDALRQRVPAPCLGIIEAGDSEGRGLIDDAALRAALRLSD